MPSDDENPFGYRILERLSSSRSLLYSIKSISSAHQHFFQSSRIPASLEERIKAIRALREELSSGSQELHTLFLSVCLIGVSSSYLDSRHLDFGQEHLDAAKAILHLILVSESHRRNPLTSFIVGIYVYWDMSCALLISPDDNISHHGLSGDIHEFITDDMAGFHHAVNGPCTELFFYLARLGRYVGYILAYGIRDHTLERKLWEKLLFWTCPESHLNSMWAYTAEAFRKHGLIMLHRYCHPNQDVSMESDPRAETAGPYQTTRGVIYQYAIDIMTSLSCIPVTSTHLALQPIPLLTAAAELTTEDRHLQDELKHRLLALYSCSRIPANLEAAHLIDETWQSRADGDDITWLGLLKLNNLKLRVG